MTYKILLAEDDKNISNLLGLYLKNSGYDVVTAFDGEEALAALENHQFHLGLFDVMMPKLDGFQLTKIIREKYQFPIIFLTAKCDHEDKIIGLDCGADDYIEKPFNPMEVMARIKANLRRSYELTASGTNDLSWGKLKLNQDDLTVEAGENVATLTIMEFKILKALIGGMGKVMTKEAICQSVYGDQFLPSDINAIPVHISNIRSKIEKEPSEPEYIINIRGLGYKVEK